MRSRLLVSAAILVAGIATASAQNAPGGAGHERNQLRKQERGQFHREPGTAAHKTEQAQRIRSFGFQGSLEKSQKNPRANPQYGTAKRHREPSPGQASVHPHNARANVESPAKPNNAPILQPRGQRGRSTASGRFWDRARAQGSVQSEQGRTGQGDRRGRSRGATETGHHQPASSMAKERGRQDLARNKASRRLPDQAMGQSGDRKLHSARNQAHRVAQHPQQHRGDASHAGQAEIRKAQAALNQQGFDVGHPDGKLGRRTKSALIAFQKQRGFQTTGKIDRDTLHALIAGGGAPSGGDDSNQAKNQHGAEKGGAPFQAAPQAVEPSTTGQSGAAPQPAVASPPPIDAETAPVSGDQPALDSGASRRVPAGSAQEDDKKDEVPSGSDQR
jgi:putative peptidoglycan binding protein